MNKTDDLGSRRLYDQKYLRDLIITSLIEYLADKEEYKPSPRVDAPFRSFDPQFKGFTDFAKRLFKDFNEPQIKQLPLSFWLNIHKVKNYNEFADLIRKGLRDLTSVAIIRSIHGRPIKKMEEKDALDKETDEIYKKYRLLLENGQLIYDSPAQTELFGDQKEISKGLSPFEVKFYDYCITQMGYDGSVPVLSNRRQVIADLGMIDKGDNWKKITQTMRKLGNIEWECLIKLPNPDQDEKERFIKYPPERLLKFPELWEKDGNKFRRKSLIPIPYLPTPIIQLKIHGNYLINRNYELFKLDPSIYTLAISIHEWFRMNRKKDKFSLNLQSILNRTNWIISAKHEKRALNNFNSALNELQKRGAIGKYHITDKMGIRLKQEWYNKKEFKLNITQDGERFVNWGLFQTIVYHFTIQKNLLEAPN